MIKAVIFDMDGVLIDAKQWHYDALNKALELFGYNISTAEHIQTYDGLPTKDKLKGLTEKVGLPVELHGLINEMKQVYTMDIVHEKCRPVFLHRYALSNLKANGYKLALCSNSIRDTIEIMMKKSRLTEYFDFMLSNQDVTKAKPDPEIYTKAIEKLQLQPKECVVVEDNINGITAATKAGANVFEVQHIKDVTYSNIMNYIKTL
ncbi:MAG: beta-phosphoglucomutase [Candidatus Deianiraeaceae bacterium]|jgi:beta-phosphoglucomutase